MRESAGTTVQKSTRRANFPELGGFTEVPVLDRHAMARGFAFTGPAIVEERESTAIVGPGATCVVDEHWNLVVELPKGAPMSFDAVTLEVLWSRLLSVCNEQQLTLLRTAFSTVVRESQDLACGAFDARGRMIAQSTTGTPGHINAMATGVRHFLVAYPPETLDPGDDLLTNDPWQTAGQINDMTVLTPVLLHGRVVAYFASTCHAPDIGGRILSAETREVFEEGLRIPITKLFARGEPNRELLRLLRANVRTPEETVGDLYAQPPPTPSARAACCI